MRTIFIKRLSPAIVLAVFCVQSIAAQVPRKGADENPLSTAFYLASLTKKDEEKTEKACLAHSLAGVERYAEATQTAAFLDADTYMEESFVALAVSLYKEGKTKEASEMSSILIKRAAVDPDDYPNELFWLLANLGRDQEALELTAKITDYLRAPFYLKIAEGFIDSGDRAKALSVLDKLAEPGIAPDERELSILALYRARAGQGNEALDIAQSVVKGFDWANLKTDQKFALDDLIDTYLFLGKYDLASEYIKKSDRADEGRWAIRTARSHLAKGNTAKALEILETVLKSLDPKLYGDSFDLGDAADAYLEMNLPEKAEDIARTLTGSDHMQQKKLLAIADYYIARKKNDKARGLLLFGLGQAAKIDTSEEEDGRYWTSGKWDQAKYQSAIASKFIKMRDDRRALEVISKIKKAYLKAARLTEFVVEGKDRHPQKLSRAKLDEADALLRIEKDEIFDENRYNVWNMVAPAYALTGMPERANEIFIKMLGKFRDNYDGGREGRLLIALCNTGVAFDRSKIEASPAVKKVLNEIIAKWEEENS